MALRSSSLDRLTVYVQPSGFARSRTPADLRSWRVGGSAGAFSSLPPTLQPPERGETVTRLQPPDGDVTLTILSPFAPAICATRTGAVVGCSVNSRARESGVFSLNLRWARVPRQSSQTGVGILQHAGACLHFIPRARQQCWTCWFPPEKSSRATAGFSSLPPVVPRSGLSTTGESWLRRGVAVTGWLPTHASKGSIIGPAQDNKAFSLDSIKRVTRARSRITGLVSGDDTRRSQEGCKSTVGGSTPPGAFSLTYQKEVMHHLLRTTTETHVTRRSHTRARPPSGSGRCYGSSRAAVLSRDRVVSSVRLRRPRSECGGGLRVIPHLVGRVQVPNVILATSRWCSGSTPGYVSLERRADSGISVQSEEGAETATQKPAGRKFVSLVQSQPAPLRSIERVPAGKWTGVVADPTQNRRHNLERRGVVDAPRGRIRLVQFQPAPLQQSPGSTIGCSRVANRQSAASDSLATKEACGRYSRPGACCFSSRNTACDSFLPKNE